MLSGLGREEWPHLSVGEALTPGPWQERQGQGRMRDQRPAPAPRLPTSHALTAFSSVRPAAGAPHPPVPAGKVLGMGLGD